MGRSRKNKGESSVENTPVKKKVKGFDTSSQSSDSSDKLNASMDSVLSSGRSTPTRNMAEGPPQWFISFMNDFERRQEVRFSEVIDNCKQAHDALNMTIQNVKDDLDKVKKELKETEAKLDDLENRNRRNNIVIFNLPEGIEGANCLAYFQSMLRENCNTDAAIQRAHRSGKPGGDKPRPVHIGFAFFPEKEMCRKALSELFRQKKFGSAKLFVSNDFSRKVQQLRKEQMPEVRRLRDQGINAFLTYPATIKIRDPSGRVRDP